MKRRLHSLQPNNTSFFLVSRARASATPNTERTGTFVAFFYFIITIIIIIWYVIESIFFFFTFFNMKLRNYIVHFVCSLAKKHDCDAIWLVARIEHPLSLLLSFLPLLPLETNSDSLSSSSTCKRGTETWKWKATNHCDNTLSVNGCHFLVLHFVSLIFFLFC